SLEQLNELAQSNSIEQILISPHAALSHLPTVRLSADDVRRTLHGIDLPMADSELPEGQTVQMTFGSELVAVGTYDTSRNIVHPTVVIVNSGRSYTRTPLGPHPSPLPKAKGV